MSSLPSLPPNLNQIKQYLEMADDYDILEFPISYWCRIFALKQGFCLVKAKEDLYFLNDLIKSLQSKPKFPSLKGISNKIDYAQHYIQSVAKHLHDWADSEDDSKHHNKYVVKAYHSAYMLFNVCSVFEELNEDVSGKAQHAKLMAAYVQNCLDQDVKSSALNQAKEVLNSYLKETLKYHKAEGTSDHNNPDVVVQLVARFVKSLTSSEREEKDNRDKIATEEMLNSVREILSLLTPSNFEEQLARIKTLDIDSEDQLAEVTDLFFEKRTNGCEKEKKKRVTAARKTTSPVDRPVQNAVIEPEIKQVSTPEMDIQIKEMPNLLPVVTQTAVEKPVIAAEAEPGITNKKQESSLSPSAIQLRLTRRNNISFDCRPRRPGIQHSLPMAVGGTTNPIQLPNAPQALSDPRLNDPVLFIVGDKSNQKAFLSFPTNPPGYHPQDGNLPPGNVLQFKPSPIAATDDGEVLLKSSSLKYTYRDDQWSPFNPEGKKTYDRNFILQLRNNPASQNKPECLSSLNCDEILPRLTKRNHPNREKVAVVESDNSSIYAKMCQALLTKEVESASNPAETTNFRKLLQIRCQKEFAKDKDVEARKKELERQLKDLVDFNKKKSLANMRFIGELFKLEILSLDSLHYSILRLLGRPEDETSLECMCVLLTAIGKQLETPEMQTPDEESASSSSQTDRENINLYFSILDAILLHCKMSSRIRFMIQNMIELRQNGWVAKKDGHKEREEQKKELNNPQFKGSVSSTEDLSRVDMIGEDLNDKRASCVSSPTQRRSDNAPFAKRSSLRDP